MAAAALAGYGLGLRYDLLVEISDVAVGYRTWRTDLIYAVVALASVASLAFASVMIVRLKREVAARRAAETQAEDLTRHDPLTGLPNRRFFAAKLGTALGDLLVDGSRTAVLMVDLDGFKAVNDLYGHATGDRALVEVAQGIAAILEPGTILARIGADEFAIAQPGIRDLDRTSRLARIIVAAISRASIAGDVAGTLGASIGIAIAPDDGTGAHSLMRRADLALARAKEAGRSSIRFFEPEMDAHVEKRARLERALRAAVPRNAIVPHYQPLVSIVGGGIIGFEALARWNDPEIGPVPPDQFIAVAEETGLINELGDRLLRQACRDAANWTADTLLAFNLSPRQLREPTQGLRILAVLAETGLDPRRLEVEITESALVGDLGAARNIIEDLRAAGVRIALDDFGTGYATLSQLVSLRFDKIKIDRSFIRRLGKDADSTVIVKAVIALANNLGLVSTAEGIEDHTQLADLAASGCAVGQGYLFGKAVPAAEAEAMLEAEALRIAV